MQNTGYVIGYLSQLNPPLNPVLTCFYYITLW